MTAKRTNSDLTPKQQRSLRRLASMAQTKQKPRYRSPETERQRGDRSQTRTPSLPPLPWKK